MGAWDATSFGNDTANDWAYDLEESDDLSYIEATLEKILAKGDKFIDGHLGEQAVAAVEVVAWLRGHPTPVDAYTEKVAKWVAAHPIQPSPALIQKALAVLDRIQGDNSELPDLWEGQDEWAESIADLRRRLTT